MAGNERWPHGRRPEVTSWDMPGVRVRRCKRRPGRVVRHTPLFDGDSDCDTLGTESLSIPTDSDMTKRRSRAVLTTLLGLLGLIVIAGSVEAQSVRRL